MGYPWQKVDNARVVADMAHPYAEGFRAPRWLASLEARAVVLLGVRDSWPARRLAERWGWGKTQTAQILKEAEAYLRSLEDGDRTKPDNDRTKPDMTGQAMASESQKEWQRRTSPDKTGQAPDTSRARVLLGEKNTRREEIPPSPIGDCPPPGQGEGRGAKMNTSSENIHSRTARHEKCEAEELQTLKPDFEKEPDLRNLPPTMDEPEPNSEQYANPHRLAKIWAEELEASPFHLRGGRAGVGHRGQRGRSISLTPVWPLELLEAGPADAEVAVRAVAELCRGTAARAPRVLDWAAFFGERAQHPSAWREALAWKLGEAGEPALGRQYVKPEKGSAPTKPSGGADPMALFYTGDS